MDDVNPNGCIVGPTMRYLLFLAFAASLAGANCGTPNGLTRSCPGAKPQSASFRVINGCGGGEGNITATVGMADDCTISILEPSGIGIPTSGYFDTSAGETTFTLSGGDWHLQNPTMTFKVAGTTFDCLGSPAAPGGELNFACNIDSCGIQGQDTDITCNTLGTCTLHLIPTSGDAGMSRSPADASGG